VTTWIIYAAYGMLDRHYDVTESVVQQYANGTTRFTNAGWGLDPYPGILKTLFIVYAQSTAERGGSTVLYSQSTSDPADGYIVHEPHVRVNQLELPSGVSILYAGYGMNSNYLALTAEVEQAYAGGQRKFFAQLQAWGNRDPYPGVLKTLYVVYSVGGRLYCKMAQDAVYNYTKTFDPIILPR
jgi:hypothetical protein